MNSCRKEGVQRIGIFFEKLGCRIVEIIAILLGVGLSYYSAFYTELADVETDVSITHVDNAGFNILVFIGSILFFFLLHKLFGYITLQKSAEKFERILLVVTLVTATTMGGIWVCISHVEPRADASSVCVVAEYILKGEFPLQPPTYMGYYPHQTGMVFILQLLFTLFGSGQYMAWQYMNVLLMPVLIFSGYRIIKILFDNIEITFFYFILLLGYMPMYVYLPYVYGDFPSTVCGMVIMWQTLSFCRYGKYRHVFLAALAAAFGCLVRKVTFIVVVAAIIILLIHGLRQVKWQVLIMAFVVPLAALGAERGVASYYEKISNQELSLGIPYACYIMMGLEDTENGPGWFNGRYYQLAYDANNYDYQLAEEYAYRRIEQRLSEFQEDKAYAFDFLRRKICTQWNMPDCYGQTETRKFSCDKEELPVLVHEFYYGELCDKVNTYMDRYQFVIYAAFLSALVVLALRKERKIESYLLIVTIIGGFLFSLLQEAMSRYVLPYVIYMIPLAAVGLWNAQMFLAEGITKLKKMTVQRKNNK